MSPSVSQPAIFVEHLLCATFKQQGYGENKSKVPSFMGLNSPGSGLVGRGFPSDAAHLPPAPGQGAHYTAKEFTKLLDSH